ncbi:MAG: IPT/TIG domain-containing protein [Acidobacteriota bacterium]
MKSPRFSIRLATVFACLAALSQAQTPVYTITNVSGTGIAGFAGDGAAAKDAQLNFPMAIARSSSGTLYIADTFNQRVRTIQSDGIIRTIAGTGTRGVSADGTAASGALLNSPYGVAVDAAGNVYIADSINHQIRKIASNGNISRIAGTGVQGSGGDGGNAVDALLALPGSLALDPAGNIYVADTFNHKIRKITTDGKISTYAGTGEPNFNGDGGPATSAALFYPQSIALDSAGNLYIADTYNHRIRKVSSAGIMSTYAGSLGAGFRGDNGPATSASLNYPRGVAVDASGNVFIADSMNSRIRMVTENGVIRTIAGNGQFGDIGGSGELATTAFLRFPRALIPDGSGGLYILDTDNSRVKRLSPVASSPVIGRSGVISSSAFGAFRAASRGSWLEIYGANLAQGTSEWSSSDFVNGLAPTELGGVSVTIGGRAAYVSYVSPGQINIQVPDALPAGSHEIVVTNAVGSSAPYRITVEETLPGILAPPSLLAGDKQYAAVILGDGSIAGPATQPLHSGDTVTLYGIGFGPVAPILNSGEIVRSRNSVVLPLQVFFGDTQATVTYAGLAPGTLGLYQINVVVPAMPAGDAIPFSFKLNGESGQQVLYTAVGK